MPKFGEHLELSVQTCHGDDGQQHSACTFAVTAAATPPDPTVAVLGAVTGSTTEPLPPIKTVSKKSSSLPRA